MTIVYITRMEGKTLLAMYTCTGMWREQETTQTDKSLDGECEGRPSLKAQGMNMREAVEKSREQKDLQKSC